MRINKGQFRLGSKRDRLRFELRRGKGHLFRYIINRMRWHYYPRLGYASHFPDHVDIEISSVCNLRCPMCYTITEEFKDKVERTLMDLALFKKLIDECSRYGAYSIRLSLRGEVFLHPAIVEMIRYAKHRGIKEVSTLTNGLMVNPELFVEVMEAGLDWLTISFDGLGETYEGIRSPARYGEAVEKIRRYSEIKKERGSVKPVVKVQTLWPAIKGEPQVYYDLFRLIVDQVACNPLIDYLHRDSDVEYEENFTCPVLWQRLTVGSNGIVIMCVNDEMGKHVLGDANEETLYEIWHGERLEEAREAHKGHIGVRMFEPCRECYLPRRTALERVGGSEHVSIVENYVNRRQEIGR